MGTINIHEAKTHLSRLVDEAAAGREIVIAKAGKPMAKLIPLTQQRPHRKLGTLKGRLKVHENFDAPLPADIDELLSAAADSRIGDGSGRRTAAAPSRSV